jgi:hypothetical protein
VGTSQATDFVAGNPPRNEALCRRAARGAARRRPQSRPYLRDPRTRSVCVLASHHPAHPDNEASSRGEFQPPTERSRVDVVHERSLAADLDDRQPLPVPGLELRIAGDVDLAKRDAFVHESRPSAFTKVAARRDVENNLEVPQG